MGPDYKTSLQQNRAKILFDNTCVSCKTHWEENCVASHPALYPYAILLLSDEVQGNNDKEQSMRRHRNERFWQASGQEKGIDGKKSG